MKVKKITKVEFTPDERDIIDRLVTFIEQTGVEEFNTINELTEGLNFAEAAQFLWNLAFIDDEINSDEE